MNSQRTELFVTESTKSLNNMYYALLLFLKLGKYITISEIRHIKYHDYIFPSKTNTIIELWYVGLSNF